jgi:protein O-GlcNAc transferase
MGILLRMTAGGARRLWLAIHRRAAWRDPAEQLRHARSLLAAQNPAGARRVLDALVARQPNDADVLHHLALSAIAQSQRADAAGFLDRALSAAPESAPIHLTYGALQRESGNLDLAGKHYARARAIDPGSVEAHTNFGMVMCELGRPAEGVAALEAAVQLDPDRFEVNHNLGIAYAAQGLHDRAVEHLGRAARARPGTLETQFAMVDSLQSLGRFEVVLTVCDTALAHGADPAAVFYRKGYACKALHRPQEAKNYLEQAIALRSDFAEAHNGLGAVLMDLGDIVRARDEFQRATQLKADFADAYNNLGMAWHRMSDRKLAQAAFRHALQLNPEFRDAHSNLIFVMGYDADIGPAEYLSERRHWQEMHAARFRPGWRVHENDPDPERRLRIGYVSADFFRHAAFCTVAPMLFDYDRSACQVVCYSNSDYEDDLTTRLRAAVDLWRNVVRVSDEELAETVRRDRIDVLVDLSGHSGGNRLAMFARKPAPVQVTAWGAPYGTGLDAIDYLFADEITIPQDALQWFSEEVVYLPCMLTYVPQDDPPGVTPLPARVNDFVTFGSFNGYRKLTDETLALWARVLAAVPGSRMLFKAREFVAVQAQERVQHFFSRAGVSPDRIAFAAGTPWREHLAAHCAVDLALDPVPLGGGIGTFDALWMGIPVVTMRGATVGGSICASILCSAGLAEWAAHDADGYIGIAARAAANLQALETLRMELRSRLVSSPAGNPRAYVRAVETVYRRLWRRWCKDR